MPKPHWASLNRQAVTWVFVSLACLMAGCTLRRTVATPYEDGTYRGVFIDRDRIEVAVEIRLENGIVTAADFRHLYYGDAFRLENDAEPFRGVIQQYREALDYLVGRNIVTHLPDLYRPERIITTEVDGFTQATVRANKIISALRDALNRGVYSY